MRQDSLQFHIQENDYFGTLATVVDLVAQHLEKGNHDALLVAALHRVRDRLMHLQHGYRIEKIAAQEPANASQQGDEKELLGPT